MVKWNGGNELKTVGIAPTYESPTKFKIAFNLWVKMPDNEFSLSLKTKKG